MTLSEVMTVPLSVVELFTERFPTRVVFPVTSTLPILATVPVFVILDLEVRAVAPSPLLILRDGVIMLWVEDLSLRVEAFIFVGDVLNPTDVFPFPAALRSCFAVTEIIPLPSPVPLELRRIEVVVSTLNLSELELTVSSAAILRLLWLPAFTSGMLIILFPFESIV